MYPMKEFEDKEIMEFSWTGLFSVTSFCFLLFSLFLKIINETDIFYFLLIGSISFILAVISFFYQRLLMIESKQKTKEISPIFQKD